MGSDPDFRRRGIWSGEYLIDPDNDRNAFISWVVPSF
jgi:hypothetical protein